MVEFGTASAFRGWVRVLGYGFGVRGRKVKSRDCALASDLVRAVEGTVDQSDKLSITLRLQIRQVSTSYTILLSNGVSQKPGLLAYKSMSHLVSNQNY